ncbi:hypothetical protein B0T24DRAFT_598149 [Lasiosphaeria ovina]|uniref:Uncharacterized protein n=1 Tax=Lasiosphaeria ovina TaxID=92902 RepID=A0AAE0MZP4_9PEZI|nr:hypothetical protein B0T24DRAFT_598149 [Lasiosphaeria ovina]
MPRFGWIHAWRRHAHFKLPEIAKEKTRQGSRFPQLPVASGASPLVFTPEHDKRMMQLFCEKDVDNDISWWRELHDTLQDEFPELITQEKAVRWRFLHLRMQREFRVDSGLLQVIKVAEDHKTYINDSLRQELFTWSLIPAMMSIFFPDIQDHRINLQMRRDGLKKVQDPRYLTEAAREDIIHLCRQFESGTSQWDQWESVLKEFHSKHDDCSWCSIEDLHFVYTHSKIPPQGSS